MFEVVGSCLTLGSPQTEPEMRPYTGGLMRRYRKKWGRTGREEDPHIGVCGTPYHWGNLGPKPLRDPQRSYDECA